MRDTTHTHPYAYGSADVATPIASDVPDQRRVSARNLHLLQTHGPDLFPFPRLAVVYLVVMTKLERIPLLFRHPS